MMIIGGGCGLCYSMPVPYYWIKTVLLRKKYCYDVQDVFTGQYK